MNDKLAATIGQAARTARERLGFTQAEVAELVGIHHIVYNRLERGRMLPSAPTLVRLCGALKLSPEVALGFGRPPKGGKGKSREEDPPSVHQLTGLARKLDENQRQALISAAKVMLRR